MGSLRAALVALPDAQAVSVLDPARGVARVALADGGRLVAALFAAPDPVAVSRAHLARLVGGDPRDALAGRPGNDLPDPGATLCPCFGVGVNTILTAIESQGLMAIAAVGAALHAGTDCGSRRPEIATLIAGASRPAVAERASRPEVAERA